MMTQHQNWLFKATKQGERAHVMWIYEREVARKTAIYEAAGWTVTTKHIVVEEE